MIHVELDKEFEEKLDAICEMVGTNKGKIVVDALYSFFNQYCDGNGNFSPRKAILFETKRVDGTQKEMGICQVLDECIVMGESYYKLFFDGKIIKAPQSCVKIFDAE